MELRHQQRHERDVEGNARDRREDELQPQLWPGKRMRTNAQPEVDSRTPDLHRIRGALGALRTGGKPLPGALSAEYGKLLGLDLSDVRVHHGGVAGAAARSLGATAFTHGTDIALAEQLDLESAFGRHVLAHELVHVAQHKRSGGGMELAARMEVGPSGSVIEAEAEHGAKALTSGREFAVASHGRLPGISLYGEGEQEPNACTPPVQVPGTTAPDPAAPPNATPAAPPASTTPAPATPAASPAVPAPTAPAQTPAEPGGVAGPHATPSGSTAPARTPQPGAPAPAGTPRPAGYSAPPATPAPAAPRGDLDARVQEELEKRADPTLKANYSKAVAGVDALRIQALQFSFQPNGLWNTLVETFTAKNAFQDHFGQIYSANAYRGGRSWADTAQAWIEGLRGVIHIVGDIASVVAAWAGMAALVTGALALVLSETVIGGIALGAIAAIAAEVAMVAGAIKLLTDVIDFILGILQMIILIVRARNSKDPGERARFAQLLRKEANDFGANVISIGVQVAVMAASAGVGAALSRGASTFTQEFTKMLKPVVMPRAAIRNIVALTRTVAPGAGVAARGTNIFGNSAPRQVLAIEVRDGLVNISRLQRNALGQVTRNRQIIPFTTANQMRGARLVAARSAIRTAVQVNVAGFKIGVAGGQLQSEIKQPRGSTSPSAQSNQNLGGGARAGSDLSRLQMWPSQLEMFESSKGPIGGAVDRTQRQYELAESAAGPELSAQVRAAFQSANNQAGQARFGAMAVQTDAAEGQANTQRGLAQTAQGRDGQNRMGQHQSAANTSVQRIQGEGGKLRSPPPKEGALGWLYNQTIGRIGGWIASAQSWVTNLVGKWAMSLAGFSKEEMDIAGIENDMREDGLKNETASQEAQDAALKADEVQQTVFRLQENKTRDEQAAIQGMADAQRFIMALEDAERRLTESITSGQNYIQQVTPIIRHEMETEDAGASIDAAYVAPVAAYAGAFSASIDSSNLGNRARTDGNGQLSAIKAAFPDIDIAPGQAAVGQAVATYETAFGQLAGSARGQAEAMQTAIQAFIGTTDYDGVNANARSLDRLAADFDRAAQQLADQLYAAINGVITQYNSHIQRAVDAANAVPDDPDAPADEPASTAAPASTPVATPTVPAAAPTGTAAPDAAPNAAVQRKSDPNAPKPTTTPAGGPAKTASSTTPAAATASNAPATASPAGPRAAPAPGGGAITSKSPEGAATAKPDSAEAPAATEKTEPRSAKGEVGDGDTGASAAASTGSTEASSESSSAPSSDSGAAPASTLPAPVVPTGGSPITGKTPASTSAPPVRKQAEEAAGAAPTGGDGVTVSDSVGPQTGGSDEAVVEDEAEPGTAAPDGSRDAEPATDEQEPESRAVDSDAGGDSGAPSAEAPSNDDLDDGSEDEGDGSPVVGTESPADAAVQRRAEGAASASNPVDVATRATAGSGGSLPHLTQIQASFGGHDVSGIRYHDGNAAQEGATQLGAKAFAIGDAVAFKSAPDLHTAAHEAAHVVQQRAGLRPSGGMDTGAGDSLEQHADAVADAVVAGRSAAPLLDTLVAGRAGGSATGVQRKGETPTIKSATAATAPENASAERYIVGVGEEISFTGSEAGTWTASGGKPDSGASSDTFAWTAPGRAGQFSIKLKVGDKEARKDIAVVEPSKVRFKAEERSMPSTGIGFTLGVRMTVLPLNVSFEAIKIQEIGGGATGVVGYFKEAEQKGLSLTHVPKATPTRVDPGNDGGIDNASMQDSSSEGALPRPIKVGSMTWQIPYAYSCGDVTKRNFTIVTQVMSIIDSKGTVAISKGEASDVRGPTATKTVGQVKEDKEADERRERERKAQEAKDKKTGTGGFASGYGVGHAEDGYALGRAGARTRGARTPPPAPAGPATVTITPESFSMEGEHVGRTNVGVGEKIRFDANRRGNWTASVAGPGGRATQANNTRYTWTAPATPSSVTITFTPGDGTAAVTSSMTVIKPTRVNFIIPTPAPLPRGMGAGMVTNVRFEPFTVSFARTSWKEMPGPATGMTGYFRTHTPPNHDNRGGRGPNPRWLPINEGNGGPTDTAAFGGFPAPWTAGSFNWVIPNRYRLDGESGDGHEIGDVVQTCTLQGPPAAGTVTVTKGISSDTRPAPAAAPRRPRRRARGFGAGTAGSPLETATQATQGGGASLPHLEAIQASFGRHDVSGVRAHQDASARAGTEGLGAQAFAVGDRVAFSASPDLHTAAHEAAHVVQQRGGAVPQAGIDRPGDALEHHADAVADAVVSGRSAEPLLAGYGDGAAQVAVQRKTKINPVASALEDKLAVLGDGTPGKPGKTIPDFDAYIRAQADWFTHADFTTAATAAADRALVWKVAKLVGLGLHVSAALPTFHVGEIAKLPAGDIAKLEKYVSCFDTNAWTVQLTTPATTLARALALGKALVDLEVFMPAAVMKVVLPEDGLIYLVDTPGKLAELTKYYNLFKPTLETQAEWEHVKLVLDKGVAKYSALAPWVHDLHVFTEATRDQLLVNITNKSRSHPVTLILFSASDWNTAFLQGQELEKLVLDTRNLALIVQGMTSIAGATAEVNRVADDYGQLAWAWDPKKSWMPFLKGRLGQVVIAGHGSDQSVEMASDGSGAWVDEENKRVGYNETDISSKDPKKNGSELLFKTVIERMDPADVNIVFAGCLVNSHDIPGDTKISSNAKVAQKNLQDALKKHPNLADYVRAQMAAMGVKGNVTAANASATFDSFKMDPGTGKATISSTEEPDLGGTKLAYLKTGIEPEGALRAALECYADKAIGPATTTAEIRTKLAGLAGNTGWWETITRVGFELCVPSAGDVDPRKLLDVSHRIINWFDVLWEEQSNPQAVANNTKPAEASKVFPAMFSTVNGPEDHVQVGMNEAWMKFDASKTAAFIAALDASSFTRETFEKHLARGVVNPKLATLLPATATPTKGQLLLALTIAVKDGKSMPKAVRELLRAAAGGAKTTSFPAARGVPALIDPIPELGILQDIGLAPGSASTSGGVSTIDGNVDTNADGKNDMYIEVSPREALVTAVGLNVRARPSASSKIVDTLKENDVVRVMGTTPDGTWSFIDHDGKTGFLASRYLI